MAAILIRAGLRLTVLLDRIISAELLPLAASRHNLCAGSPVTPQSISHCARIQVLASIRAASGLRGLNKILR